MYAIIIQYRDDDSEAVACSRDFDTIRKCYWEWVYYFARSSMQHAVLVHPDKPITLSYAIKRTIRFVQLVEIQEI